MQNYIWIAIGSALLILATIATVLMLHSPNATSPAAHSLPAAVGSSALLDQHERHPNALPTDTYAPLDQLERHSTDLLRDMYTSLDQHERHTDLFAPKAEPDALPGALDRYLAAHDR